LRKIPKLEKLIYGSGAIIDERTGSIGGNINATHKWMESPQGKQARQEYEDLIYGIASMVAAEVEDQHAIAVWLSYNYQKVLQELEVSAIKDDATIAKKKLPASGKKWWQFWKFSGLFSGVGTKEPKSDSKTYSNDKYNFSINYTKDWRLKVLEPNPLVNVNLNIWLGDTQGKVACSIMVGPIGNTIYGKTLQELENRARISRQGLNAQLVSSKNLTIDGIDAYEHVYTAENPHRYVKQVGFFKDNDEYLLLFKVFSKEDFEKYEFIFDEIIQSFRFKNKIPGQELKESVVLSNKGNSSVSIGSFEEDIRFYDKALEIDLRNPVIWNNKGNSLYSLDHFDDAISCYNKALEIDTQYALAWSNKGIAEEKLGRIPDSIHSYKQFIALSPLQYATQIEYARQRLRELKEM
jgi:tetratricopeptide (TPR) repeat protein